jgi:transcriptional regulator with XRE-family HTH domain
MTIEKRIEKARQDVRSRLGQQREIARALGVHYNWVRRFASGELVEPGAIKFAHLEEWLAKN